MIKNSKILKIFVSINIVSILCLNVFAASTIDELEDDITEKRKQLQQNQDKLQGIDREVNNIRLELLDLNAEINSQNAQLDDLNTQLDEVTKNLEENQRKITNATDSQESAEDLLKIRLRSVYENGSANTWELLFSSASIMDFFKKRKFISDITEYDKSLIETVSDQKEYLNNVKSEIELQKIKLDQIAYDKEQVAKSLELSKANLQSRTDQLNKNKTVLNALNTTLQKEEQQLSEKLAAEIIKLQAQSGNIVSEKGFLWPFPGSKTITCHFGGYAGHTGMDISARVSNTTIVASKSGKVIKAVTGKRNTYPWSYDYGNYIVIDHGSGQSTLYAHLASVNVSVGQFVSQGGKIGMAGNTGYSTGPHLHFEVRINGVAKNPANYL